MDDESHLLPQLEAHVAAGGRTTTDPQVRDQDNEDEAGEDNANGDGCDVWGLAAVAVASSGELGGSSGAEGFNLDIGNLGEADGVLISDGFGQIELLLPGAVV